MKGGARIQFALVLFLTLSVMSCDGVEAERQFTDDFLKLPAGYTAILDRQFGGDICTPEDTDDWRINPTFRTQVLSLDPAMPNPSASGLVTILMNVISTERFVGGLFLIGLRQDGSEVILQQGQLPVIGFMGFQFNTSLLSTESGLYRIYIADQRSVVTYGDIKIVQNYPTTCQEALAN